MNELSAAEIIALLNLTPHPEGGWYRQTFSDTPAPDGRALSTAIYYLLEGGVPPAWHRIDAAELWHWYGGAPLKVTVSREGKGKSEQTLGPDLAAGQRPQITIPSNTWQCEQSQGNWTLVGCTVAPGFQFSRFEMKPGEWQPS